MHKRCASSWGQGNVRDINDPEKLCTKGESTRCIRLSHVSSCLPVCVFERGLPMSIKHIMHIKPQNSGHSVSAGWRRARAGVYSGGSTAGPFSARSYY